MTLEKFILEVDKLMKVKYGIGINDVSQAAVEAWYKDGDTPRTFVDHIGKKYEMIDMTPTKKVTK